MENGTQPATKQDLAEVRTEMENRMQAMEDRLIEAFRDSQTELPNAFYSFTESNRQRVSQVEANQASLITRVGTLGLRFFGSGRLRNGDHGCNTHAACV